MGDDTLNFDDLTLEFSGEELANKIADRLLHNQTFMTQLMQKLQTGFLDYARAQGVAGIFGPNAGH